jgi:hypothetical protein
MGSMRSTITLICVFLSTAYQWRRGYWVSHNTGNGPRVPLNPKMKICSMLVLLDLVRVSSSRRLRQRNPLCASCLEIDGLDGISHPCFFPDRLVSGEIGARLCYLWGMSFSFHGEVRGGEWHGRRDLRTSNGGSSLCGDEELAWCNCTLPLCVFW